MNHHSLQLLQEIYVSATGQFMWLLPGHCDRKTTLPWHYRKKCIFVYVGRRGVQLITLYNIIIRRRLTITVSNLFVIDRTAVWSIRNVFCSVKDTYQTSIELKNKLFHTMGVTKHRHHRLRIATNDCYYEIILLNRSSSIHLQDARLPASPLAQYPDILDVSRCTDLWTIGLPPCLIAGPQSTSLAKPIISLNTEPPSRHNTLYQCWFNVGPTSLDQRQTNIDSTSCVCWDCSRYVLCCGRWWSNMKTTLGSYHNYSLGDFSARHIVFGSIKVVYQ